MSQELRRPDVASKATGLRKAAPWLAVGLIVLLVIATIYIARHYVPDVPSRIDTPKPSGTTSVLPGFVVHRF